MRHYIAVIHKDKGSDYGVSFPDFPGCITAGSDLKEAAKLAEEALAFHVRGMLEDGEELPEPSDMEQALAVAEPNQLAFLSIPLEEAEDPIVRVNVTLPKATLSRVDRFAKSSGMTRSGFLATASEAYISGKIAARSSGAFTIRDTSGSASKKQISGGARAGQALAFGKKRKVKV